MKRVFVAAAVALSLGFVSAGKADAQVVYGYSVTPTGNGIVTNRTVAGPLVGQSYSTFYSPFTGVRMGQVTGYTPYGASYGRSYGYNPWTGMGYNQGFYQPNVFSPFGGYNYSFNSFGRRW